MDELDRLIAESTKFNVLDWLLMVAILCVLGVAIGYGLWTVAG